MAGRQGAEWVIWRLAPETSGRTARQIYRDKRPIERSLAGPRPFLVGRDEERGRDVYAHRLFFGIKLDEKRFRVESVTEDGRRRYWVVGPGKRPDPVPEDQNWRLVGGLAAASALPVAFHPTGHLLLWEDAKGCFHAARYATDHWEKTEPLPGGLCGGSLIPTPHGIGLLHWRPDSDGAELLMQPGRSAVRKAAGGRFILPPAVTADGRGLVGVTREGSILLLDYAPIEIPSPT